MNSNKFNDLFKNEIRFNQRDHQGNAKGINKSHSRAPDRVEISHPGGSRGANLLLK
jgi:hypothetical protein